MLKKLLPILLIACPLILLGQDKLGDKYEYSYHQERLTPNIELCKTSALQSYYDSLKRIYDTEMGMVLGEAKSDLTLFSPQSPLSNFLTDIVYEYADSVSQKMSGLPVDMSILNFGGIRSDLAKGEITVGNIYSVLSFDNLIVVATMKGSELNKVFKRFTAKMNQPYSHAKVTYLGDYPTEILVNGQKIDENKSYRVATLDFLVFSGGDGIFDGVTFDDVYETNCLFRQVFLDYVAKHKVIDAKVDDRVVIKPQR